jgi:hypothetical protein
MAVDDSRRRRVERVRARKLGFQGARFVRADARDVGDAVGVRAGENRLERRQLRRIRRHDQLAAAPVRHAALGAVGVQALAPRDAGARLERARRIVDAGVDHLGVARAGVRADGVLGLEDHHLAAGERQRARHREAHHPGADDCGVDAIQVRMRF